MLMSEVQSFRIQLEMRLYDSGPTKWLDPTAKSALIAAVIQRRGDHFFKRAGYSFARIRLDYKSGFISHNELTHSAGVRANHRRSAGLRLEQREAHQLGHSRVAAVVACVHRRQHRHQSGPILANQSLIIRVVDELDAQP